MKCLKCGTVGQIGSCGCWIKLRCTACKNSRIAERAEIDPPNAVSLFARCPACGPVGSVDYFDADGRKILLRSK